MPIKKYSRKRPTILTEIRADLDEWLELLGSNPTDKTLAFVGIDAATWSKIAAGKSPLVPIACYRLASFSRYGHMADIAGSAWRDFYVRGDTLVLPGIKQPCSAPALRSAWLELQELPRMRRELDELRQDSDRVEISPQVHAWLNRLGRRPLVI